MKSRVNAELKFQDELLALNGALDMVLAQVSHRSWGNGVDTFTADVLRNAICFQAALG